MRSPQSFTIARSPGQPPRWWSRLPIGGSMIGLAVATAVAWSIGEAFRPSYPKGWVIARVNVLDPPIVAPFGNTRAPEAEREAHVRQAVSDEVLEDVTAGLDPGPLRRRLHVWSNPPNSLYISIHSDEPLADRRTVDAVANSYLKFHKGSLFHPAALGSVRTYPRAIPVAFGLSGLALSATLLGGTRVLAARRRHPRGASPPAPDQ